MVFAIPQITSSRRLFSFAAMERQVVASLRDARQQAMSQRKTITFRYEDAGKQIVLYGGSFGNLGDAENQIVQMSGGGLQAANIMYGFPTGVTPAALSDGASLTALSSGVVELEFEGDGSVRDGSDNPIDNALFFYHNIHGKNTAFAVSILGASGRVKIWQYNGQSDAYVE